MTEELQQKTRLGAYRIIRRIGGGGMGQVYEAEHVDLHIRRALKIFETRSDHIDFLRKRFISEGRILADLNHPRVVRVYDLAIDETTGTPYFAMDLVLAPDGSVRTLEQARQNGVDEHQVAIWFRDICEGLAYIHAKGVVHRDISLDNILIGPDGHAVISDFGISRIVDERFRRKVDVTNTLVAKGVTGLCMGKESYMAPELRRGGLATPATDAWALGVAMFRLLTGFWYEPEKGEQAREMLEGFEYNWSGVLSSLCSSHPDRRIPLVGLIRLPERLKRLSSLVYSSQKTKARKQGSSKPKLNLRRILWSAVLSVVVLSAYLYTDGGQHALQMLFRRRENLLRDTSTGRNEQSFDEWQMMRTRDIDAYRSAQIEIRKETVNGVKWSYFVKDEASIIARMDILLDECVFVSAVAVPKKSLGTVTTPQSLGGCSVVAIRENAFAGCGQIAVVKISEGVESLAPDAFADCPSLKSIELPASLTKIATRALPYGVDVKISMNNPVYTVREDAVLTEDGKTLFRYFGNAERWTVPSGVTKVASGAIVNHRLKEIVFPDGLAFLERNAVSAHGIQEVCLPESLVEIKNDGLDMVSLRYVFCRGERISFEPWSFGRYPFLGKGVLVFVPRRRRWEDADGALPYRLRYVSRLGYDEFSQEMVERCCGVVYWDGENHPSDEICHALRCALMR